MIQLDLQALTPRQRSVFDYIVEYQQKYGIAPTIREIGDYLGLRSPGGVHRILGVLKEKGYIQAEASTKRSWRSGQHVRHYKELPLLGRIAAGEPVEAVENIETMLAVDPQLFGSDACFALRVQGDSMINAHIMAGDIAIIRPQTCVENGEIAAVLVQGEVAEATLKRIFRQKNSIRLEAENEAYSPLIFKGTKRLDVSVIGKLVGVIRCTESIR